MNQVVAKLSLGNFSFFYLVSYLGNHKLVRVLPHVYHENPEVILSHIADLIHMLHECEVPEKSSILQLCCLAARDRPQVRTK